MSNKDTVLQNNDDISYFFILYQWMMLVGTILGPGSIFIVLSGGQFNYWFITIKFHHKISNFASQFGEIHHQR